MVWMFNENLDRSIPENPDDTKMQLSKQNKKNPPILQIQFCLILFVLLSFYITV